MKKILLIAVCCLCFVGCTKDAGYEVSELIPNTEIGMAHLKGTLKNVSNNDCKMVQINVEFSSGTINEDGWVWIESPKEGESISFNEILYGASDIESIENYQIKFKNIECWIKEDID